MILADRDIKEYLKNGKLEISELDNEQIQAGWVDLSLGNHFRLFKTSGQPYIDVRNSVDITEKVTVPDESPFIIHPGEFVLGQVKEKIKIPADLAACVDGRSSLGRIGIVVHVTSGFVDPGFSGHLVLEMTNVGRVPVALHPGMKICKLVLFKLSSEAEVPYFMKKGAKYCDQNDVDASKINKEFEK